METTSPLFLVVFDYSLQYEYPKVEDPKARILTVVHIDGTKSKITMKRFLRSILKAVKISETKWLKEIELYNSNGKNECEQICGDCQGLLQKVRNVLSD